MSADAVRYQREDRWWRSPLKLMVLIFILTGGHLALLKEIDRWLVALGVVPP